MSITQKASNAILRDEDLTAWSGLHSQGIAKEPEKSIRRAKREHWSDMCTEVKLRSESEYIGFWPMNLICSAVKSRL